MQRADLDAYRLPESPGIYRFYAGDELLYVGKATSLRDRVRSYFSSDVASARSAAIAGMVSEADRLDYEVTDSVLEALILEANTIKNSVPRYNSASKDNTSFNYLVITEEAYPQVLVVRGRDLFTSWKGRAIRSIFGPFPQGSSLREALAFVRRIFPFRDNRCTPASEKKEGRPCFNRQIGLCPGVCTGLGEREYLRTIRHIELLFRGRKKALIKGLENDMQISASHEDFERAAHVRRQIAALTHIRDVALIKSEARLAPGGAIRPHGRNRIEAYDIAHTAGSETVGVMVVVEDGEERKQEYRKFKIRDITNNDTAALTQALSRRFMHPEWPYPRLIVIDGGKAQLNAARAVLERAGILIPLVNVVKDDHHRPLRIDGDKELVTAFEKDILRANDEAHRFALSWHRRRLRHR